MATSRAAWLAVVLLACGHRSLLARAPITLTPNITTLEGLWLYDATKGLPGSCGNTIDQTIRFATSAQGVTIESRPTAGLMRYDGSPTTMTGLGNFNGVARAALDAGWLAITTRHPHVGANAGTRILQDVFIVRSDEMTVWRTFNLELLNGTLSQNVCGNRQALVYQRQRQP